MTKKIIFIILIIHFSIISNVYAQFEYQILSDIQIGEKDNQVKIADLLDCLDFEISGEKVYIVDFPSNCIKVFNFDNDYLFKIKIPTNHIMRIYSIRDYLVIISDEPAIFLTDLHGIVLNKKVIKEQRVHICSTFFYKNLIFLPKGQQQWGSIREDMILYEIFLPDTSHSNKFSIQKSEVLQNSYNPVMNFNFFPIEREHQKYLKKLKYTEINSQSVDYILFSIDPEEYLKPPTFYIYTKHDSSFKKIGILPEEQIGSVWAGGFGYRTKIYQNKLYFLGIKNKEEYFNIESKIIKYIIISSLDLNQLKDLPAINSPWQN